MFPTQNRTAINAQCGTALLASMLMLLVITIISVTAMKNTMMDESMARNVQNDAIAFQVADGVVNRTLNDLRKDDTITNSTMGGATEEKPFDDVTVAVSKTVKNKATIVSNLSGNPRGSCANYDCPFVAHRFNVTGSAKVDNTHAAANILQNAQKEPYLRDPDRSF